jgi:hypothetical protein
MPNRYVDYGSAKEVLGDAKHHAKKITTMFKQKPTLAPLIGSFVLPCLFFCIITWLRSFHLRFTDPDSVAFICYGLMPLPLIIIGCSVFTVKLGGDGKLVALLGWTTLLAWFLGWQQGT